MPTKLAKPEIPDAQRGNQLSKLLQLIACPIAVMCVWYTCAHLDGSFAKLFEKFYNDGLFTSLYRDIWGPVFFGTRSAWTIIGIYGGLELLFMKALPGKMINGPETMNQNVPVYKANGQLAYVLTLFLYVVCSDLGLGLYPAGILYVYLGEILGALNFFSMMLVLFLYFKGHYAPSDSDFLTRESFIADYYWGIELYPKILGWHVKQFTNARFGMMAWPILLISYAARQYELYGYVSDSMMVSVFLQFIYVSTFFYYEEGYFFTMDIQHDRAGFYLCWGCLVWVPCVYTSPAMYLVHHPNQLGPVISGGLIALGLFCFWMKTNMNRQRYNVRESDCKCTIWGKPPKVIRAKYTSMQGEQKESILLVCGWWGVACHFHYVGEILGAFCWSWPSLFDNFLPYFYVAVLIALLTHRANRDDTKCAAKYGKYWTEYRKAVPYKIVPYVF